MTPAQDDSKFDEHLAALEAALEQPLIPGELERWSAAVCAAAADFAPQLAERWDAGHEKQYAEIETEDPALIARVENLRSADREIKETFDAFRHEATRLQSQAADLEPDERKAADAIRKVKDLGLPLVIQIREQEAAITTWHHQSLNRDRGIQD